MKEKRVLLGKNTDVSKFQLILAAAKRSKQINRMCKDRGLPPNQVATIKTDFIKPPTIAFKEVLNGKIVFKRRVKNKKEKVKAEVEVKEEVSP